ncbi:MAG: aldehyde ferredoxin oxidoreductase [Desulfovibrionales bacterium]|nr:aldehyde ferredoxin oxidoreductase [Desulfovibrionales bacterium]
MKFTPEFSRVLHIDLETEKSEVLTIEDRHMHLGGSGLAAVLYERYGHIDAPADDPRQPLVFAIGPLTGMYPLMSKVACGFRSPYTGEWSESHAGGRLALALRFAGYDALMITGKAKQLSAVIVGSREFQIKNVEFLRGKDVFATGKFLRRFGKTNSGHRSTIRIGQAGERGVSYACINVDSFRHFGRMGSGSVMGAKNLKGIVVSGDNAYDLPEGKAYPAKMKEIYEEITQTGKMKKYHDLGTPQNILPLNELNALPWNNLQKTHGDAEGISGETFAEQLLLRQVACSGCPVGCIHIGLLRQQFASEHEYLYKQVSYDYEPIFAQGTMLGITSSADVLALLDETEKLGLDCMSAGVALAWATEAREHNIVSQDETIVDLEFGNMKGYLEGLKYISSGENAFYQALSRGAMAAAKLYGGEDFACVLGQEMAGYATGEVFFVASAYGFRHSHLDTGGYAFDQNNTEKDAEKAVKFMLEDEVGRIYINCMMGCLFARASYGPQQIKEALDAAGFSNLAANLDDAGKYIQRLRWKLKCKTGFDVDSVKIPKRFTEVVTWKGGIDTDYMDDLAKRYGAAIKEMAADDD